MCDFFDQQFWQQLIATAIGVVLGVPAALWINRRTDRRKEASLLKMLRESLVRNQHLASAILEDAKPGITSFMLFDISILESTGSMKFELIRNQEVCEEIDRLRFILNRLNHLIILRTEFAYSAMRASNGHTELDATLIESIHTSVPKAQQLIEKCLSRLG